MLTGHPPLISADTSSRDVTWVKCTFNNLRWVSYFFVTSDISGVVCFQTLTDSQRWAMDRDLITVHENYFLLITVQGK
jgi:hypothetical protein